jgi:hypothetical protein
MSQLKTRYTDLELDGNDVHLNPNADDDRSEFFFDCYRPVLQDILKKDLPRREVVVDDNTFFIENLSQDDLAALPDLIQKVRALESVFIGKVGDDVQVSE